MPKASRDRSLGTLGKHDMSLFRYNVKLEGGATKNGSITAKTEEEARKNISSKHRVLEWLSIKADKPPTPPAKSVKPAKPQTTKQKSITKLEKMLYLQAGKCFFCRHPLALSDASIEHLHPRSKGGNSTEDNEVVCCAALNQTFGNMDLRAKFDFVINAGGSITCPRKK